MKNLKKIAVTGMAIAMLFGGSLSAFAQSSAIPTTNPVNAREIRDRADGVRGSFEEILARVTNIMNRLEDINQRLASANMDTVAVQSSLADVRAKYQDAVTKVGAFKAALTAYQAGSSTTDLKAKALEAKNALRIFIEAMKTLHAHMESAYNANQTGRPTPTVAPTSNIPVGNVIPNNVNSALGTQN